jgi:Flp pilus assembly CpaF family ATPase
MVNAYDRILVEKNGQLNLVSASFISPEAYHTWLNWIIRELTPKSRKPLFSHQATYSGFRLDTTNLPDLEPTLLIRLSRRDFFRLEEWVDSQVLSAAMAIFLTEAVRKGQRILISGGTGSAKTTLLRSLMPEVRGKMAVVEDFPELMGGLINEERIERFNPSTTLSWAEAIQTAITSGCDCLVVGETRDWSASLVATFGQSSRQILCSIHARSAETALERFGNLIAADRNRRGDDWERVEGLAGQTFDLVVGLEVKSDTNGFRHRWVKEIIQVETYHQELKLLKPLFTGQFDEATGQVTFSA